MVLPVVLQAILLPRLAKADTMAPQQAASHVFVMLHCSVSHGVSHAYSSGFWDSSIPFAPSLIKNAKRRKYVGRGATE